MVTSMQDEQIDTLAGWMFEAERIVVFTGAGISTDSGIPDYRGPDGVWTRRDRGLPAHERPDWTTVEPNACHEAVTELQALGKLDFLVSQNIDNLHIAAGIEFDRIAELHGNRARRRCRRCERTFPNAEATGECPDCGGELASSVVGFGDALPSADLDRSFEAASRCDLMIVLGSSLVVTPAALVPQTALEAGATLVIVNRGETPLDDYADLRIDDAIAAVFPPAVERLKRLLDNE